MITRVELYLSSSFPVHKQIMRLSGPVISLGVQLKLGYNDPEPSSTVHRPSHQYLYSSNPASYLTRIPHRTARAPHNSTR